jgi:hypothetical protein
VVIRKNSGAGRLTFSPDGRTLAAADADGPGGGFRIDLWSATESQLGSPKAALRFPALQGPTPFIFFHFQS